MLPVIPKPPISRGQKRAALVVAGFVDLVQLVFPFFFGEGFFSPIEDALDLFAAVALTAICGFKWQFAAAFMLELIPVFDILPTWTAVVLLMPTDSRMPTVAGPQRVNVSAVHAEDPHDAAYAAGSAGEVVVDAVVIPTAPPRIPPVQSPPMQSR